MFNRKRRAAAPPAPRFVFPSADPVQGKLGWSGAPFQLATQILDLADNQRTGWQILSGPGNPIITVFDPYQSGTTYQLNLQLLPPDRWVRVPGGDEGRRVPVEVIRRGHACYARWCDEDDPADGPR